MGIAGLLHSNIINISHCRWFSAAIPRLLERQVEQAELGLLTMDKTKVITVHIGPFDLGQV